MKDKLKILHIWNMAGVPQTLAKYQRKLGHKADVITRITGSMTKDIADQEVVIAIKGSPSKYALAVLARAWKYDIIHAHAPRFYNKYISKLYPRKKWVAHFHGTDIRGKWEQHASHHAGCDFLAVSTPELLTGCTADASWIPNPVDTSHFIRTGEYIPDTALFIMRWERQRPALEQAIRECMTLGLKLTVLDRETQFIPRSEFPAYLQQFEFYVDTKTYETYDTSLKNVAWGIPHSEVKMNDSLSLTALQQLAMGGKVVNNHVVINKFPEEHRADTVAQNWIDVYRGILK